jgi:hypothetical protein
MEILMPSDRELVDFSEHVLYEMMMVVGIPRQFDAASMNEIMMNALLESFVMHARQLENFFFDHAETGDPVASNYFDDAKSDWKMVRGKEDSDLKEMVARVSTEIVHLTLHRIQPKKVWNLLDIANRIETLSLKFLERAPATRISQPDKARFLRILQEYKEWLATRTESVPQTPVMILTSVSSGWPTGITSSPHN